MKDQMDNDEYLKKAKKLSYQRYLICKERGHQPSDITLLSIPPWNVCKHCGTKYRREMVLTEMDAPTEEEPIE